MVDLDDTMKNLALKIGSDEISKLFNALNDDVQSINEVQLEIDRVYKDCAEENKYK
jgi:hypothetical protein